MRLHSVITQKATIQANPQILKMALDGGVLAASCSSCFNLGKRIYVTSWTGG
jgi:hypothetical protein